jgi:hypothetical protein
VFRIASILANRQVKPDAPGFVQLANRSLRAVIGLIGWEDNEAAVDGEGFPFDGKPGPSLWGRAAPILIQRFPGFPLLSNSSTMNTLR